VTVHAAQKPLTLSEFSLDPLCSSSTSSELREIEANIIHASMTVSRVCATSVQTWCLNFHYISKMNSKNCSVPSPNAFDAAWFRCQSITERLPWSQLDASHMSSTEYWPYAPKKLDHRLNCQLLNHRLNCQLLKYISSTMYLCLWTWYAPWLPAIKYSRFPSDCDWSISVWPHS
jgi:hypothetical protein